MGWTGALKDMAKKYGRVAIGVHLTVSGLCFSACYLAILNSVDVESILDKAGLGAWLPHEQPVALPDAQGMNHTDTRASSLGYHQPERLPEAGSSDGGLLGNFSLAKGGGAFAIAWLCNKALFPVRVPITIGLTPPIWRFLISKGFRV